MLFDYQHAAESVTVKSIARLSSLLVILTGGIQTRIPRSCCGALGTFRRKIPRKEQKTVCKVQSKMHKALKLASYQGLGTLRSCCGGACRESPLSVSKRYLLSYVQLHYFGAHRSIFHLLNRILYNKLDSRWAHAIACSQSLPPISKPYARAL